DGNVVTSRGPGTAMDFSLTLVELLRNRKTREEVESGLVR
ncbi:MAG TPA: DJ-1 family protein, partial [Candidatus Hydrogenedentes bacterium]|nr:DJ-1 family protein [Candidatus Hydrogenedentota bacterium]